MKRFIAFATAAVAAGSLGVIATGTPAAGAGDPVIGMEVLDMLCVARGGTAYNTPYTISRCQQARAKHGFVIEELICEGLLDGDFAVASSGRRHKRATWICSPGAAA